MSFTLDLTIKSLHCLLLVPVQYSIHHNSTWEAQMGAPQVWRLSENFKISLSIKKLREKKGKFSSL